MSMLPLIILVIVQMIIVIVYFVVSNIKVTEDYTVALISSSQQDQFPSQVAYNSSSEMYRLNNDIIRDNISVNEFSKNGCEKNKNMDVSALTYKIYSNNRTSNPEQITRNVVNKLFCSKSSFKTLYNVRYSFNLNPKTKCELEYDIVIPDLRLAIEYNGGHHSKAYPNTVYRDRVKLNNAAEQGFYIISIPEVCKTENSIRNYIINDLKCNPGSLAALEYFNSDKS